MSTKIALAAVVLSSVAANAFAISSQEATPIDGSTSDSNTRYQTKVPANNSA
jgi:hypothetical protein